MTTTTGITINLKCLIFPETDENLISVLDCANDHDAIIFDNKQAYIVPKQEISKIKHHLIPIAEVNNNEYILKVSGVSANQAKLGRGTNTTTVNSAVQPQQLTLRMCNPETNTNNHVRVTIPPKRKRGRPRKTAKPNDKPKNRFVANRRSSR